MPKLIFSGFCASGRGLILHKNLPAIALSRHSISVLYEDAGLNNPNDKTGWIHSTYNLLRYEEGRESIGIAVLLLWVKYANGFKVYR